MKVCVVGASLNSRPSQLKKRFLREGVLDEMIQRLQIWDQDSLREPQHQVPSLAALIQIFETNKIILQQVETLIERTKNTNPDIVKELTLVAYLLQIGLRNAFIGIEDEKMNLPN